MSCNKLKYNCTTLLPAAMERVNTGRSGTHMEVIRSSIGNAGDRDNYH